MTLNDVYEGIRLAYGGANSPSFQSAFLGAANDTITDMTVRLADFSQDYFTDLDDTVSMESYYWPMFRRGCDHFMADYGEQRTVAVDTWARYEQEKTTAMIGHYHA